MEENRKRYHRGRRKKRGRIAERPEPEGQRTRQEKNIRQKDRPEASTKMQRQQSHGKRGRSAKKQKSNLISNIILVIAIIVFCVSAFQLFRIMKGYYDGRSEYDKIRDLAIETGKSGEEDEAKQSGFQVNFEELLKINPDTIGWIRFDPEPSVINYPIVQGNDNSKYLKQTFSANENTLGAIFLNVDNRADFTDKNSIIYGHRMKDGSMFRHLQDYEDRAFWEANPYFYIYTPTDGEIRYHIYSVGQVEDTSDTYLTVFNTEEEYRAFLNMTKEVAMYDTGVEVTVNDTIVTLSTCTSASDNHRFVVRGVREEGSADK